MTSLLNSSESLAMLSVLAEIVLKSTLLLVAGAAIAFALRGATASLRHLVWTWSLAGMLAIPALSLVLPRWQLPLLSAPMAAGVSEMIALPTAAAPIADRRIDIRDGTLDSRTPSDVASQAAQTSPDNSPRDWIGSLILLWLGGVAAGIITIAGGFLALRRIARQSRELTDAQWTGLIAEMSLRLGIDKPVRALISDAAPMPATWGVMRPTVLLPADAENWDEERKRVVLLHELAHVRRNDCLTQVIAQLCCAVYWFHPGAWYIARRLRSERELACDEDVLDVGVNACDYAAHLLEIAARFRAPQYGTTVSVAMARPSHLEGRLRAILGERSPSRFSATPRARAATIAGLAALSVPLAAMRPWRSEAPNVPSLSSEAAASLAARSRAISPDTFRWKGVVRPGKWVEVLARYSDMSAERSTSGNVEIVAIRKFGSPSSYRIAVDQTGGAARVCLVSASSAGSRCDTNEHLELTHGLSDTRVDFLVRVPAGVGLSLHTEHGNIAADGVDSYVWGTSGKGDISIVTSDLAEASTSVGNISAVFGRRSWRQNLEFLSDRGDVTVVAPSDANMMIEAETSSGQATSEFAGRQTKFGTGQRIMSRTGTGRGMLTIRTGRGKVELKRGSPAVGEASSIQIGDGDAPGSSADPKPNPNPDNNPNPNPNQNSNPEYNPDENPLPEIDNASVAAGGLTGELLPVVIPAGLVNRLSDAAIRGWPEAAAIARLRDVAATHVKQHSNDYVRERSEWALTLVRSGEIVTPLRNALSSADWRERAYAAWALGATRDPRASDALTAALSDVHWRVRMHAAASLGQTGGAPSVPQLIRALSDKYWQVRAAAVDAIANTGDRRALPSLVMVAIRDPHTIVRDEAQGALERMK